MSTLEIASIGLQQDAERLRVLSHNVANITTAGYKRQVAVQTAFTDVIGSQLGAVSATSTQTDIRSGKLRSTGAPLDIALKDREFLMVQTASGALALTRGGSLRIDAQGKLVTQAGLQVQGVGGTLSVPVTASNVQIDASGQLIADDRVVGSLQVMKLADGASLETLGDGLFNVHNRNDIQVVQTPQLTLGHTEASNVVSSQEMVALMAVTRHAESMVRLMQGADEMLGKTISKLGEMG